MEISISDQILYNAVKDQLEVMVPNMLQKRLDQELLTKRFYNLKEAGILLGMSFNTLKKHLTNGDIKYSMVGNRPGFTDAQLVDFINSGKWSRISLSQYHQNKKKL